MVLRFGSTGGRTWLCYRRIDQRDRDYRCKRLNTGVTTVSLEFLLYISIMGQVYKIIKRGKVVHFKLEELDSKLKSGGPRVNGKVYAVSDERKYVRRDDCDTFQTVRRHIGCVPK